MRKFFKEDIQSQRVRTIVGKFLSSITPITHLLKKNVINGYKWIKWTKACDEPSQEIKKLLVPRFMVSCPNYDMPIIQTNSSNLLTKTFLKQQENEFRLFLLKYIEGRKHCNREFRMD